MNSFQGTIIKVDTADQLSLVQVQVAPTLLLTTIIIETPETASYLQVGHSIKLLFKETEVVIGIGETVSISLQNRIPVIIGHIEQGQLLSKIRLNSDFGKLTAIITTNAVQQLGLHVGHSVYAMIKTNEIMLGIPPD